MDTLVAIAALAVAIAALRRSGRRGPLVQRLERLEAELRALRSAAGSAPPARPRAAEPRAEEPRPGPPWAPGPIRGTEPRPVPAPSAAAPPRQARAAPVAAPPSPPPRRPAAPPPSGPRLPAMAVDWERWVGVRGAAVLGGVVLALAGLYFFQYSIEHGLIPPWLRVAIGTSVGLGCIAGAELRARARYEAAANALIGGGAAVLYAAFWSARALYGLIGTELAFVLMIAVTAACTALSYRHASLVIALLGLIGGFATPFALSTGEDRPIALFSYLLLLDAALLFVAHRRGWSVLALLSLVGTLGYQAVWIGARMSSDQLGLALGMLGVFALLYAASARQAPAPARGRWLVTHAGAALFPFAFALYFAATAELERHFYPVAALLALLSASACVLARRLERRWLGLAGAAGSAAATGVWLLEHTPDAAMAWEAAAIAVVLAGVFHVFVEREPEPAGSDGPAPAAASAALLLGAPLVLAASGPGSAPLWPWLAGWLGLGALLWRQSGFPGRAPWQLAPALGVALGLAAFDDAHRGAAPAPTFSIQAGVFVCVAIVLQAAALLRPAGERRRWGERAAALFPVALLVWLASDPPLHEPPLVALGASALLGLLALLAATRAGSGRWLLAATAATALAHGAWTRVASPWTGVDAGTALALQLATVVVFTGWPFAAVARFRNERFAWVAVAGAGPAWFLSLRELFLARFGDDAIGLLPIGLAALALAAAAQARRIWPPGEPLRKSNLAWLLGVAFGFVTVAVPLQLEKEWITIGWALEAAALAALWRRLDHPGLKYLALALVLGVTVRLVANEAVLGYYPRPAWRIVNWLLYTYLVPAAALLGTALALRGSEVERARHWEEALYRWRMPLGAAVSGVAAIAIVFVWINLAIADWFAVGETLRVSFARMPARDLVTSLAWALYALLLLGVGVRADNGGLRWLSLALMLVTVVKVFLYDLGELEDLYRVGSLLGLAISLIAISLAYQRFVVRRPREER